MEMPRSPEPLPPKLDDVPFAGAITQRKDFQGTIFVGFQGGTILHNTEGPAVIYKDGKTRWYWNGVLHRSNGPAVINPGPDGHVEWWVNGKRVDPEKCPYKDIKAAAIIWEIMNG